MHARVCAISMPHTPAFTPASGATTDGHHNTILHVALLVLCVVSNRTVRFWTMPLQDQISASKHSTRPSVYTAKINTPHVCYLWCVLFFVLFLWWAGVCVCSSPIGRPRLVNGCILQQQPGLPSWAYVRGKPDAAPTGVARTRGKHHPSPEMGERHRSGALHNHCRRAPVALFFAVDCQQHAHARKLSTAPAVAFSLAVCRLS